MRENPKGSSVQRRVPIILFLNTEIPIVSPLALGIESPCSFVNLLVERMTCSISFSHEQFKKSYFSILVNKEVI